MQTVTHRDVFYPHMTLLLLLAVQMHSNSIDSLDDDDDDTPSTTMVIDPCRLRSAATHSLYLLEAVQPSDSSQISNGGLLPTSLDP